MLPLIDRKPRDRALPPGAGFIIAAAAMVLVYLGLAAATGIL